MDWRVRGGALAGTKAIRPVRLHLAGSISGQKSPKAATAGLFFLGAYPDGPRVLPGMFTLVLLAATAGELRPGVAGAVPSSVALSAPRESDKNAARPPDASEDLTERARHLFDAIVSDRSELADDFFFPREPFIPLKDVRDPARYFDGLIATYHQDIRRLHGSRKSWDGAKFLSFELGSRPRWVKPGEEWNKIGYFRTFGGKLYYEITGRKRVLDVHTIISWDGRWYVTHLAAIRK